MVHDSSTNAHHTDALLCEVGKNTQELWLALASNYINIKTKNSILRMCHSSSSNETPERSHCIDKQTTKLTKSGYDKNDWIWKIKQWEAIATGNVYVDTFISAATFNETAVIWQNKKTGFLVGCCFIKRQNADVAFDSKNLCTRIFGLKNDRRVVVIRKTGVWSYVQNIFTR